MDLDIWNLTAILIERSKLYFFSYRAEYFELDFPMN
jgi:hypothetical protein